MDSSPSCSNSELHDDEPPYVKMVITERLATSDQLQRIHDLVEKCRLNGIIPLIQCLQELNDEFASVGHHLRETINLKCDDKKIKTSNSELELTTENENGYTSVASTLHVDPEIPLSTFDEVKLVDLDSYSTSESSGQDIPVPNQKVMRTNELANKAFNRLYKVKSTYVMQGITVADCFYSWYNERLYECDLPMTKEQRKCFGLIHMIVTYTKQFLPDNTIIHPKPIPQDQDELSLDGASSKTLVLISSWEDTIRNLARSAEENMMKLCNKFREHDTGCDEIELCSSSSSKRKRISPLVSTMYKLLRKIPWSAFPRPQHIVDFCKSNFPSLSDVETIHRRK